jgi:ABC-type Zn uptake system ZnuABC Zn-binding protein ZnuA
MTTDRQVIHGPDIRGYAQRALSISLASLLLLAAQPLGSLAQSPVAPATLTPAPVPSPEPDALRVVTTTTVIADIVRNVAREHAQVVSIVPAGVGPEDYEPRPGDAQLLADAALIVSNGVGLDDFLQKLLDSGTGGRTPQLVLGEGVPPVMVDGVANPHFWLDPSLVAQRFVPAIIGSLSTIDPGHGADYGANGASYAASIDALDALLAGLVAEIPEANRKLVTFHDAFPYLARHYGFQLIGVILANVGSEPSAADLARLVDQVRAAGVRAVFGEAQFSPELARTLADEAGITTVVSDLYTDALGDPPADTYLGLMRTDIERIVDALR